MGWDIIFGLPIVELENENELNCTLKYGAYLESNISPLSCQSL
jgi:hypothetical protein